MKESLGYCRVNTAALKDLSPNEITEMKGKYTSGHFTWDFPDKEKPMSAETAAIICTRIRKALEPSCYDHSGRRVSTKSSTFHEHGEHKKCEPRQSIILILGNKEKTLQDLKMVGFNPDDQCVYFDPLNCIILSLTYT